MKANVDWRYEVEDYPNDRSSERKLTLTAFGRRLTLAWSSPLRRHTGKDMGDAFLDDDDEDDGYG